MKPKPISFAAHFAIDEHRLSELGVFNPILNFDTPVFVEPLLLKASASAVMREAFTTYNLFFKDLLTLIYHSNVRGDKCWRAAERKIKFPEYKSTCLGYGQDSIDGSGSGRFLNRKILESAKEIADIAKDNPAIFLLLPLLEEGIGADIISDMTQHIIDDDICRYTVSVMEQLGIEGIFPHKTSNGITYKLPYNPYHKCPVKLLPVDILSDLPLGDSFDDWLVKTSEINRILRDALNRHLGEVWMESKKAEKKEAVLELIKNDKTFFFMVLKVLQESSLEHYDIEQDYQGLRRWLEDSKKFTGSGDGLATALASVEDKQDALFQAVRSIITHFQDQIENQEVWRIFWVKYGSKFRHVHELYSQMLFYMVSDSWLTAQDSNIRIDKEFFPDSRQIHFTFSISKKCRVTVQVKHANSTGLSIAYDKQRSLVAEGKAEHCFFVVMNFESKLSKQFEGILSKPIPDCKVVEIHACAEDNQPSLELDGVCIEFEGSEDVERQYIDEKRKGGASSYQAYKPLKSKTESLCQKELRARRYPSALSLCHEVARLIEDHHTTLLDDFAPYRQYLKDGSDWIRPTFYGWCNESYKAYKTTPALTE